MRTFVEDLWRRAKSPRTLPLGPVELLFSLRRAFKVSNNRSRRLLHRRLREAHASLTASSSDKTLAGPQFTKEVASQSALLVGAGAGFGYGVAKRLAAEGFRIGLASRDAARHDPFVTDQIAHGGLVHSYGCDASMQSSVSKLFAHVESDLGPPDLVIYCVQEGARVELLNAEISTVEHCWRSNCLGAFNVTQAGARLMVHRGQGTVILVGATSGVVGRAGYLNLALGKFGLRALSQVAARELGPKGIHVAHLIIDAEIEEAEQAETGEPTMYAGDIAEVVLQLHRQPRSAWTQEMDARPFNEKFWEHC